LTNHPDGFLFRLTRQEKEDVVTNCDCLSGAEKEKQNGVLNEPWGFRRQTA